MADSVETIDLGSPRPTEETGRGGNAEISRSELGLLEQVAHESGATRVVHMYADAVLGQWARSSVRLPPTTICVFFAARHYPKTYASPLTLREVAREARTEIALALWRRRREAFSVLALDEANAGRWAKHRTPAFWLPEPPVPPLETTPAPRAGVVLYGALAPYKGFPELVDALSLGTAPSYPVTVAGPVRADFSAEFDAMCGSR